MTKIENVQTGNWDGSFGFSQDKFWRTGSAVAIIQRESENLAQKL